MILLFSSSVLFPFITTPVIVYLEPWLRGNETCLTTLIWAHPVLSIKFLSLGNMGLNSMYILLQNMWNDLIWNLLSSIWISLHHSHYYEVQNSHLTPSWDTWVTPVSHCTGLLHWGWSPCPMVVPKRLIYNVVLTWSLVTVLRGMHIIFSSEDCDCGHVGRLMEDYISQTKTTSIYRLMSSIIHKYSIFWFNLPSAPFHYQGKWEREHLVD